PSLRRMERFLSNCDEDSSQNLLFCSADRACGGVRMERHYERLCVPGSRFLSSRCLSLLCCVDCSIGNAIQGALVGPPRRFRFERARLKLPSISSVLSSDFRRDVLVYAASSKGDECRKI